MSEEHHLREVCHVLDEFVAHRIVEVAGLTFLITALILSTFKQSFTLFLLPRISTESPWDTAENRCFAGCNRI